MELETVADIGKNWYELHPEGLSIIGTPTIEEYLALGGALEGMAFSLSFWWGDYILYGEDRADWGEMYSQALETTGRAYHTLTKAVSVCRKIPMEYRVKEVPFSTHAVLARMSEGSDDDVGHKRIHRWLHFVADWRMTGQDTKTLIDAFLEPPVDLRYENELQEMALVKTNMIKGELPLIPEIEEDDDAILVKVQVLEDRLDVALDLLLEVWKVWPSAVEDHIMRRIEDVINRQTSRIGGDSVGVGSAEVHAHPVVQDWQG